MRRYVTATGALQILDVATGTADLAIELTKIPKAKIIGIDISRGMLDRGDVKIERLQLEERIQLQQADSENLPFEDETFDAITVSFGVRNFENLESGMKEMLRVLKPGGMLAVLEFSKPRNWFFSGVYWFYFKYILPTLGRLISKDATAYTYLPESVAAFPEGQKFADLAKSFGYSDVKFKGLTFGISTLYRCVK